MLGMPYALWNALHKKTVWKWQNEDRRYERKMTQKNPRPIIKTKYIEYQITSQILHGIKGYTFLVLLQYVNVFQQSLLSFYVTLNKQDLHKLILNLHGITFGYVLRAFNIFMVMVPRHSVKGAYNFLWKINNPHTSQNWKYNRAHLSLSLQPHLCFPVLLSLWEG